VDVKLCAVNDVPAGELKQFNAGETEILVANVNNQFFCLAARCTHAGAPLAEGELNGEVLTCPWHGSRFKVTDGTVIRGPAQKPLGFYKSLVKEDFLFVEL